MARMRTKRHLPERMERAHEYWFDNPSDNKGNWRGVCSMPSDCELWLELGCGKGKFATEQAALNPDVLYVAFEREPSVILAAIEKSKELGLKNIFFVKQDIGLIEEFFEKDEVDRVFINFCDPWTRQNKPKRRLTYRDFLTRYKTFVKPGAKLAFKTDNTELFDFSLEEFKISGMEVSDVTYDLHNSEFDKDNIRTEFEQKFADEGIAIKRAVARFPG